MRAGSKVHAQQKEARLSQEKVRQHVRGSAGRYLSLMQLTPYRIEFEPLLGCETSRVCAWPLPEAFASATAPAVPL